MFQLICPGVISFDPDPICAEGWTSVVYGGFLPAITLSDAWALGGAIVALWALAWGLLVIRQMLWR